MDDWKKKIGAATVYSTNPDFKFETEEDETETLPNNKQQNRRKNENSPPTLQRITAAIRTDGD